MTDEQKLELIKSNAPIMWLHEHEAFIPVDCVEAVEISELYRKDTRVPDNQQPNDLDDLGLIKKSNECYLKIKDLDLLDFQIPQKFVATLTGIGPSGVAELARLKYGRDFMLHGVPTDDPNLPKYYGRVSNSTFTFDPQDEWDRRLRDKDPGIFGQYTLIEYFYYFVYNEAWNQHQGDWDSKVELYVKGDRKYMITYLHHERWVCRVPEFSRDITSWIDSWNSLGENEMGTAYTSAGHPHIFVALGAHGGYPTPGYSIFGLDLPGILFRSDVLTNTDERQIGRICLLPGTVSEDTIRTTLRNSNIEANRVRFGKWREPELVKDQKWLGYEGRWGQKTKFKGWDGPQNPPITRQPPRGLLKKRIKNLDYSSGTVLRNWHGV